jgi:hypothetical protein
MLPGSIHLSTTTNKSYMCAVQPHVVESSRESFCSNCGFSSVLMAQNRCYTHHIDTVSHQY